MALRALLITSDLMSFRRLSGEIGYSTDLEVVRATQAYPDKEELRRLLQLYPPDLILLQFGDLERAIAVTAAVEELGTGHPVVAMDPPPAPDAMLRILRSGVRDVLESPATPQAIEKCVHNIARVLERQRPQSPDLGRLYCFLPAKPGSGTSVIAMNSAVMLSKSCDKRVLLCDLDLTAGVTSFYLKIAHDHSIRDAVNYASKLDEDLWNKFVTGRGNLHLIGAGVLGSPASNVSAQSVVSVIDFARRIYGAVCVDLSGAMEPWTIDMLSQASHIFLVSTQEVAALHLGRAKCDLLRELGLLRSTSVLLNRTERRQALSVMDIERLFDIRVRWTFPNDYRRVTESTVQGEAVGLDSDLGRQFHAFAASLLDGEPRQTARVKRRFLDFFAVGPQRITTDRRS